jgi:hypothetical protein
MIGGAREYCRGSRSESGRVDYHRLGAGRLGGSVFAVEPLPVRAYVAEPLSLERTMMVRLGQHPRPRRAGN